MRIFSRLHRQHQSDNVACRRRAVASIDQYQEIMLNYFKYAASALSGVPGNVTGCAIADQTARRLAAFTKAVEFQ